MAIWLAGTAGAVAIAWLGADTVLSTAGVNSGMPVVITVPFTPPATAPPASSAPSPPASAHPTPTPTAPSATPAPAPPTTAATTPGTRAGASARAGGGAQAGTDRTYVLTGGHVTLDVTATSATLVSAVPDAGWAVQTWSGTDWLRVDFSSGSRVSSLIASWNGHAPSVVVTNG